MLLAVMVSAVLGEATPPPDEVVPQPERPRPVRAGPRSGLLLGADAFVDGWPSPVQRGANRAGQYGQILLAGGRLTAGYQHRSLLRGLLVVELAYAASQLSLNTGQDGLVLGLGAEGDYVVHELLVAFARVTAGWTLTKQQRPGITDRMLTFAAGVRVFRFLDLHVSLSTDFWGNLSPGIGAALGWQWLLYEL